MAARILALNTGSSSVKCAVFATGDGLVPILKGGAERTGSGMKAELRNVDGSIVARAHPEELRGPDDLTHWIVAEVLRLGEGRNSIAAVHRVVHGGTEFCATSKASPQVLEALKRLASMAPLHQLENLAPVEVISQHWPDLEQFLCFDTAFHSARSRVAKRFALPLEYERQGVVRYGFHGLSYASIVEQMRMLSPKLSGGRMIVAHLGSGASLCAIHQGRSVDTTMSFTPLDGLVMGTRCGDLDPGAVLYLIKEAKLDLEAVEQMLYRKSGLLGASGSSGDIRQLLESIDPEAAEAVALYCHSIVRHLGGMVTSLGGMDILVFTGGVGQNQPEIRRRVCEALAWLGVVLDANANEMGNGRISAAHSRIEVWAIATDEERVMAEQAARCSRRAENAREASHSRRSRSS